MVDVDKLELLLGEATDGPWKAGRMDMVSYHGDGAGPFKNVYVGSAEDATLREIACGLGSEDECRSNAALIAELRNAAPALIREIRELRGLVAALDPVVREQMRQQQAALSPDMGEGGCKNG